MLLEEIIRFDKDKNFDRVIAAQLAIALANKLNPVIKINSLDADNRIQAYYDRMRSTQIAKGKSVLGTMGKKRTYQKKSKLFL